MAPKGPALPQTVKKYVVARDRKLGEWHLLLEKATFIAALVLMSASVVSIHWAMNLVGFTGYAEIFAWAVPLFMEVGMAAVASTATTTSTQGVAAQLLKESHDLGENMTPQQAAKRARKQRRALWVIFSFVMALAQAANIGHAISYIAGGAANLPPIIPDAAVYIFAAAFAALFPLGGTMFIHVSGFLRKHGHGNDFITADAELVEVEATPGQAHAATSVQQRPAQRAPRVQSERAAPAQPSVQAPAQEPVREPSPAGRIPRTHVAAAPDPEPTGEEAAARVVFDRMVAADPHTKPDAAVIQRDAPVTKRDASTVRRWRNRWWKEHQEALGMGAGDPIEAQVAADGETQATRSA